MSYCTECKIRNEKKYRNKKGEIDFSDSPIRPIETNKPNFCYAGYTQNPNSHEATMNVIKNGGLICKNNPFISDINKDSIRIKLLPLKQKATQCTP